MLLMDIRKAFDTVSRKVLLQPLHYFEIRGAAHDLLKATFIPDTNLFQ